MGGDKIVLLDGAGANGGGAATNGLLSMIPGMFANLIGGNKMDPNLVAALMNGRNNQDGFGGANGWWLWIIVLFWLWGGRGFGNGFGNGKIFLKSAERRSRIKRHGAMSNMSLQCTIRMVFRRSSNVRTSW